MAKRFAPKKKLAMRAEWNGAVLAESRECLHFGGIVYFPGDSLKMEFFRASELFETVPKLGERHYYHLEVKGKPHSNAAFFHPAPVAKEAKKVQCYVGFWKGVPVNSIDGDDEMLLLGNVSDGSDEGPQFGRIRKSKSSIQLTRGLSDEPLSPHPQIVLT